MTFPVLWYTVVYSQYHTSLPKDMYVHSYSDLFPSGKLLQEMKRLSGETYVHFMSTPKLQSCT